MVQSPHIGAVIDFVRRDGVAKAMPRQKYHLQFTNVAKQQGRAGQSVRRAHNLAAA